MKISLNKKMLLEYVVKQLNHFYPDQNMVKIDLELMNAMDVALDRLEYCFKDVVIKNYHIGTDVYFDHLHMDQYSQFLYFFSNTIWKMGLDESISQKIMGLNRAISGMFVSYKCELPKIFLFYHAVGTVIGNAVYNDYLVIFQNVTINTSDSRGDGEKPVLGKGVFLGAGVKIVGSPKIGDRVSIGASSYIYNQNIGDDCIAINVNGKVEIKKRKRSVCHVQEYYKCVI